MCLQEDVCIYTQQHQQHQQFTTYPVTASQRHKRELVRLNTRLKALLQSVLVLDVFVFVEGVQCSLQQE